MNFKKFNGKHISEVARHRKDLSCYCMNYYEDDEGNIIFADSNDDDYTVYCLVIIDGTIKYYQEAFAESFKSLGDKLEVFYELLQY